MTERERERRSAVQALVAKPDEEIVIRAHHLTIEGKPERYEQIPANAAVYVQQPKVDRDEAAATQERV